MLSSFPSHHKPRNKSWHYVILIKENRIRNLPPPTHHTSTIPEMFQKTHLLLITPLSPPKKKVLITNIAERFVFLWRTSSIITEDYSPPWCFPVFFTIPKPPLNFVSTLHWLCQSKLPWTLEIIKYFTSWNRTAGRKVWEELVKKKIQQKQKRKHEWNVQQQSTKIYLLIYESNTSNEGHLKEQKGRIVSAFIISLVLSFLTKMKRTQISIGRLI